LAAADFYGSLAVHIISNRPRIWAGVGGIMKVAVAAEVDAGEPRVAATPETVKKIIGLGAQVAVEPGAGTKSGILDADFSAAGAAVTADAVNGADVVLKVRRRSPPSFRASSAAPSLSPSWTLTAMKTHCALWPMPA